MVVDSVVFENYEKEIINKKGKKGKWIIVDKDEVVRKRVG